MPEDSSIHPILSMPTYFWKYPSSTVYGFLIDQLLVFGSAGFTTGAYQNCRANHVVLAIEGLEMKTRIYLEALYRETVIEAGAQQVLISHWDNFFRPLNNDTKPLGLAMHSIGQIKALGMRYGQEVMRLIPLKTIQL